MLFYMCSKRGKYFGFLVRILAAVFFDAGDNSLINLKLEIYNSYEIIDSQKRLQWKLYPYRT